MTGTSGRNESGLNARASAWFSALQEQLITACETLETEAPADLFGPLPGVFQRTTWQRQDHTGQPGGGGTMAVLKGRLFEKAGVHVSTVHGEFSPEFRSQIRGTESDSAFWACGVSVIIHPRSPHVPAVHFNTRRVVTQKAWFGGGSDLTPVLNARRTQDDPDSQAFHTAFETCCTRHPGVADYPAFKNECDRYFFLKHRNAPRGIGGIFFDYLDTPNPEADFAFVQDVGRTFLSLYPALVRANFARAWTPDQREEQLVRRSHYVEFNLLYDRGTLFGLKTGGNVDAILSSMPPEVKWP